MTVVQMTLAIRDALKNWAEQTGSGLNVQIAMDHSSMWNMAVISQDFPRVILCFDRQEVRGGEDIADVLGKVNNHFQALISRGRGYDEDPGTDLVGSDGNNQGSSPPFYDLVEQARDAIRQMNIVNVGDPDTEGPVYFRGIEKVPYDPDMPVYGYLIHFSIGTQIGDLVTQNENN